MPLTDRPIASSRLLPRAGALIAAVTLSFATESTAGVPATKAVTPVVAPRPESARWHYLQPVRKAVARPHKSPVIVRVLQDGAASSPDSFVETPQPLAIPADAQPLPKPSSPLDALIQEHLANCSPEEQQVWREELQDLPLEAAREILSARKGFESITLPPDLLIDPTAPPSLPAPRPAPASETPQALKPRPQVSLRPSAGGLPSSGQTLNCLQQAEQAALHNIANAATPGYQAVRCLTQESADNAGITDVLTRRDTRPGPLNRTGRALDLAILGRGYFQVRQGDTVALTRSGAFRREPNGRLAILIAGQSWALHPEVIIPAEADAVTVDVSGNIRCRFAESAETITVGQIEFALPRNPALLVSAGGSLLAVPDEVGPVRVGLPGSLELGGLRSGSLEGSNVDLEQELRDLERLRLQISAWSVPANPAEPELPAARTAGKPSRASGN